MFRVRMCKNGLCDCVCEVGASHEGTCSREPQHSHQLFKYVSKGVYFVLYLISEDNWKLTKQYKYLINQVK